MKGVRKKKKTNIYPKSNAETLLREEYTNEGEEISVRIFFPGGGGKFLQYDEIVFNSHQNILILPRYVLYWFLFVVICERHSFFHTYVAEIKTSLRVQFTRV